MWLRRVPLAALVAFAGACSDEATPADAGARRDAGADAAQRHPDAAEARPDAAPDDAAPDDAAPDDAAAAEDAAPPREDAALREDAAEVRPDAAPPADAGAPTVALTVSGTITGAAPSSGAVVIIWRVTTSEPQRIYGYGSGTSMGAAYVATLADVPPPQAINADGIAIGTVAFLRAGVTPPMGLLMGPDFANMVGLSARHTIIYKAAVTNTAYPWAPLFPTGYGCARCVRGGGNFGFDGFEPAACDAVRLDLAPSGDPGELDLCQWI